MVHRKPSRARRGWLIALGTLVVLVVVFRLVLDPIATSLIRKKLSGARDFRGAIAGAHISIFPPAVELSRFKLIEHPGGEWKEPLLYAEHIRLGVYWRQLLRGNFVGRARLESPKILAARKYEKKKQKGEAINDALQKMSPLTVDRIEVIDGEVVFSQGTGKNAATIWINNLEMAVENIATREALAEGRPTTLTARARVQRSGILTAFVSMDPFAKGLTFAGRVALRDLSARDLYSVLAAKTGLKAEKGTVSLFTEFTVRDGQLSGGVKPVLANLELASVEQGVWDRLKGWLADTAVELASDRVAGRNAVATTIPLSGRINDPDVQILPAILGVIRNAFVVSLQSGFSNLPPRKAGEKEGVVEQVTEALTKSSGPPEAQPKGRRK